MVEDPVAGSFEGRHFETQKTASEAVQNWAPQTGQRIEAALVWVRVALPEVEVRRQVKRAGGRWDPHRCLWELRYERVVALGLSERNVISRG